MIDKPSFPIQFAGGPSDALAVFEETLRHEQKVTGLINDLIDLTMDERDHATNVFLQWFVTEQVEEEESVGNVVEQLKLLGRAKEGLFLMDLELAKRPAPEIPAEAV